MAYQRLDSALIALENRMGIMPTGNKPATTEQFEPPTHSVKQQMPAISTTSVIHSAPESPDPTSATISVEPIIIKKTIFQRLMSIFSKLIN